MLLSCVLLSCLLLSLLNNVSASDSRRIRCGAYILEDGNTLDYYHIGEGSVIHPLYERYGDTLDASAAMLIDPTWCTDSVQAAIPAGKELVLGGQQEQGQS
eukprot:768156-Hanusia_phi.AAC.10